jgi:hypothetical protein
MSYNFIAFRFTDNDFHRHLKAAIEYVNLHKKSDLSDEVWKRAVSYVTDFYSTTRYIDSDYKSVPSHRDYINKYLDVSRVQKIEELGTDFFEGFVLNVHTNEVFYVGY